MKKMNNKGFTLIELLAVITILGILMMVAIPAVSRTIENSRRDTFADVAQNYINAVRTSVLANELKCCTKDAACSSTDLVDVAATGEGTYYFQINTGGTNTAIKQQTNDLMESGGKSSWGNADVEGYVKWTKSPITRNGVNETETKYYIVLKDASAHGLSGEIGDQKIKRTSVVTSGASYTAPTQGSSSYICTLG